MKVSITSGNLTWEVEGKTEKELFEELATLNKWQETFTGESCGLCGGPPKYVVREVDGNKFYELQCKKCYAKLEFGQAKQNNTLFPKRFVRQGKVYVKDADGKNIPKGKKGWEKYETKKE